MKHVVAKFLVKYNLYGSRRHVPDGLMSGKSRAFKNSFLIFSRLRVRFWRKYGESFRFSLIVHLVVTSQGFDGFLWMLSPLRPLRPADRQHSVDASGQVQQYEISTCVPNAKGEGIMPSISLD